MCYSSTILSFMLENLGKTVKIKFIQGYFYRGQFSYFLFKKRFYQQHDLKFLNNKPFEKSERCHNCLQKQGISSKPKYESQIKSNGRNKITKYAFPCLS